MISYALFKDEMIKSPSSLFLTEVPGTVESNNNGSKIWFDSV